MIFEEALTLLKAHKRLARKGWNGNGMFVYMTEATIVPAINMKPETANYLFANHLIDTDETVKINSHFDMRNADGSITIGWSPSQVDMNASDWRIVYDSEV